MHASARRGLVVVLGGEPRDLARKLLGERGTIRGVRETDFGFDCQSSETLARVVRPLAQARHFAKRSRRDRDDICGRESIRRLRGALREASERFGRHEIGAPGRANDALDAVADPFLFDELDESFLLELFQMVADLLPRHVERSRNASRGLWLGEHSEDTRSKGSEEDGSISHGANLSRQS